PEEHRLGTPPHSPACEVFGQRLQVQALGYLEEDALGREEVLWTLDVGKRQTLEDRLDVLQRNADTHEIARVDERNGRHTLLIAAAIGAIVAKLHVSEWLGIAEHGSFVLSKMTMAVASDGQYFLPGPDLQADRDPAIE